MRRFLVLSIALASSLAAALSVGATESDPICYSERRAYEVGAITCIPSGPDGSRELARCVRTAEGAQWNVIQDSCPVASLQLPDLLSHVLVKHPALRASFGH